MIATGGLNLTGTTLRELDMRVQARWVDQSFSILLTDSVEVESTYIPKSNQPAHIMSLPWYN